jgi:hypothetical protein
MPTVKELMEGQPESGTVQELMSLPPATPQPGGLRRPGPSPPSGVAPSNSGTLGDLGTSVKRGVQQLPGIVTGIADILPALTHGARPFSSIAKEVGEFIGFRPGKWADEAAQEYSPGYRQAQSQLEEAWKTKSFKEIAGSYLENPGYVANIVAESLPSTFAGGFAGRGLAIAGRTATAAEGWLLKALGKKTGTAVAAGAGEGLVQAGASMSEATGKDQRKNAIAALGSGVVTGTIGIGAGRLAQEFGLDTVETLIAKGFDRSVKQELSLGKRLATAGAKAAGGAASEGLLQELPQSAQETVWQNYADGKPLWEGVPRAAVEGALAGFVMGAGANSMPGRSQDAVNKTQGETIKNLVPDSEQVIVQNGMAAITIQEPNGPITISAPVDEIAQHIASGEPIQTLPSALEEIEAQRFAHEARIYNQENNQRQAEEALRQQAAQQTQRLNEQFDKKVNTYDPAVPVSRPAERATFPGSVGEAVSVPIEDVEAAEFGKQALRENQVRNQQGLRSAARPAAPETAETPYVPELPPDTRTTVTNKGGAFASPSAVIGAVNRQKPEGFFEVVPQGTGFVAEKIEGTPEPELLRKNGEGFSTEANLQAMAKKKKIDLTGFTVKETTKGFVAVPDANVQEVNGVKVRYDGEGTGLHYFTALEGPSKGGTFTTEVNTPEAIQSALENQTTRFEAPAESGTQQTAAPKIETTLGEVIKQVQQDKGLTGQLAKFLGQFISKSKLDIQVVIDPAAASSNYTPKNNVITIKSAENLKTSLHEIIHGVTVRELKNSKEMRARINKLMGAVKQKAIKEGIITPAQMEQIESISTSREFKELFSSDMEYGRVAYAFLNEEEFLAQAFSSTQFQSLLKAIYIKQGNVIKRAWDIFIGTIMAGLGIRGENTVFGEVLKITAELAQQNIAESEAEQATGFAAPDSTSREIINLPAFKKWFGDSKVVDENGNPLVVYHGTTKDFSEFKPNFRPEEQLGFGIHFTEDATFANEYSSNEDVRRKGKNPSVYPAYLKAKNPLNADSIVDEGSKEYRLAFALAGKSRPQLFMKGYDRNGNPTGGRQVYLQNAIDSTSGKRAQKIIQEAGYDAVIYNSRLSEIPGPEGYISGGVREAKSILVFEPTQIKSVFNTKWDGADPDINESFEALSDIADRAMENGTGILTSVANILKDPKAGLHNAYIQHAPKWLSVTPLRTLVQTFGKTIPQIGKFSEYLDEVVSVKTDLVDTSAVNHDKAKELAEQTVGVKTFNRAAATASYYQITPWADIMEQDWVPKTGTRAERLREAGFKWANSGMKKSTGKTFVEAYKETKTAYNELKTAELKQAYEDIVGHLAAIRNRERNNLLTYIEKVSANDPELNAKLMSQFNATFSNLKGAYWPLARVGDYIIEYTDGDGDRVVQHISSRREQQDLKQALLADGIEEESIKEDFKSKQPQGSLGIPQELMAQLSGAVTQQYTAGVDPNNEAAMASAREQAQEAINDMNQIWLRWQPETSALKNSVRRKNVKGWSEDMLRSYLDYVQHHASSIAWTEQGKKIEETVKSLSDELTDARRGEETTDITMKRHILNDLRNRVHALRSAKVGRPANILGRLATGYYMTSPSIALVQMSQLGALTYPKLATMFGVTKAAKALANGTRMAFSTDYTRKEMFDDPVVNNIFANIRETVSQENMNTPQAKDKELGDRMYTDADILKQMRGLSEKQRRLLILRESMARNLLDISAAHEAYELTQGKDPNSLGAKAFKLAMTPMRLSELASRKTAILATLELADGKNKNFFEAMDDISDVVNDTLYSYAKENKGAALQGGISRVLLQFQHYRIMTAVRLGLLLNNSLRGETAEVKKEARKEFIGIMGMTGAMAGSMGVPFAGTMFAALSLVMGSDDEPEDPRLVYQNWVREKFGEGKMSDIVLHGLPAAAGVNLTRRIGLSDLYGMQNDPPPWLHGEELAAWWAMSIMGPAFSVPAGWAKGYNEAFNKGNYMRGLEDATPKPIRDTLRAYRIMNEGLKSRAGVKLMPDESITASDIVMLSLGFYPEEISKIQNARSSTMRISTAISERRGKLITQAAKAVLDGGENREEAYQSIQKFNSKMPRFVIKGSDIKAKVRAVMRGEAGIKTPRERAVIDQYEVPVYY